MCYEGKTGVDVKQQLHFVVTQWVTAKQHTVHLNSVHLSALKEGQQVTHLSTRRQLSWEEQGVSRLFHATQQKTRRERRWNFRLIHPHPHIT